MESESEEIRIGEERSGPYQNTNMVAEQTLPLHVVSVAENFMNLNKVAEWLIVEVAWSWLVTG